MIWLTLRQFRTQAAVVFGGLAVLAAALLITGPGLADDYDTGIASCGSPDNCSQFSQLFFGDHQGYFSMLAAAVVALPGLIGIFWGAPLITRELEHGTHRLVWNQSITRTRWLSVKLGLIGLAAVAAAGLAVLAVDWWTDPLDKAASNEFARITPLVFVARGVVPMGYAAFAFALGVTVGVILRRTLPAIAVTLLVFVAVQIAVPQWVRPHLVPSETKIVEITAQNHGEMSLNHNGKTAILQVEVEPEQGAWTMVNDTVNSSGRKVDEMSISAAAGAPCAPPPPDANGEPPEGPPQACFDYIKQQGFRQKVVYHPADHFWRLQWAETGLFAVLALGLTGFCFYWTRRRNF
ncbi:ABC transporter permease [Actinomadura sp. KC06]|uniref:ABC transporter permease n=1 Tax=Actinomadura sp. KC06 TaxID=2530369 RepID=UPI00104B7C10|nr:ABC transporter permease [Actinomadura sp. KC06]TDD35720.1 ABC transporter permease [Actinomadura sp. KC06]